MGSLSEVGCTDVQTLLDEVNVAAASYKAGTSTESSRVKSLEAAKKLVAAFAFALPIRFADYAQTSTNFASRTAVDLGIFRLIAENGQQTATQLAKATNADKQLIVRILRALISIGFLHRALKVSLNLSSTSGLPYSTASPFLKLNGYKNPTDPSSTPWHYSARLDVCQADYVANNPRAMLWDWLALHPEHFNDFHSFLELLAGFSGGKDDVLLIDIAGGRGQDVGAFAARFPSVPGRLILQDLPYVIKDITKLDSRIEKMVYDFFTPQPVQGARIYYLKFILHDWPTTPALKILKNVTAAMKKGYSQLIIEEFVVPETKCPQLPTMWDLEMMSYISAMERTEAEWRELLGAAGLKVVNVWPSPGDGQSIIQAELA
ncbi:MAG: hypothetical protein M1834_009462 [Cirrosporium novae-zelandiae]|nr:MAG: hypothetical protein M1834_009462 [Cirrosporium novae-zelandiae]